MEASFGLCVRVVEIVEMDRYFHAAFTVVELIVVHMIVVFSLLLESQSSAAPIHGCVVQRLLSSRHVECWRARSIAVR